MIMGDIPNETKPLLQGKLPPPYTVNIIEEGSSSTWVVGINDLPPPYQAAPNPTVTCRVCQTRIDISDKRDQHVVKCEECNEATPIKNPPAGKKYVRCPCNCLLICKSASQRIACPRADCKRVINLSPSPVTPPVPSITGMSKVTCVSCRDTFLFNTLKNALARCPHCRKVSSVGREFAAGRGKLFLICSIMMFTIGIGVTVGTYQYASAHGGTYFVYVGVFFIGIFLLFRSIYYYRMKVSTIEGPV